MATENMFDTDVPSKLVSDFGHLVKQQQAFFQRAKMGSGNVNDEKLAYFN